MHAIKKLVPVAPLALLALMAGSILLAGCQSVAIDNSGGGVPPAGVIRGTVNYIGPPPCTQNGHVVGNAIILVFDARNPPPPAGLGTTAANFGVVPGDTLFKDWPVTLGANRVCPDPSYPPMTVSAPYAISPMDPGGYVIQAFFDYTGNFFATFKFRQLPEAGDIGGGYIDLIDAQKLVPNPIATTTDAGATVFPVQEQQSDPNYLPHFLPVGIGTQGPTPSTSLWGVPTFTMPVTGYLADNVTVTIAAPLRLSRPYFYPAPVMNPTQLTTFTYGPSSEVVPPGAKSGQNPLSNPAFVPVLTFPQDTQIYAQPSVNGVALGGTGVLDEYQAALPEITLQKGVPLLEQPPAAEAINPADPFHMQLGVPGPTFAPGGNGGIYVWWNGTHTQEDCGGDPNCAPTLLDFIPESGQIFRMWPLVVLAKLVDLPTASTPQPNPNDVGGLIPQGSDGKSPIVIIQGITLFEDSILHTTNVSLPGSIVPPLPYPDFVGQSNLKDHVSVLLRPSTLCLDPRAPDNGGVLVATGSIDAMSKTILGQFPPSDTHDRMKGTPPIVVNSTFLTNPQLSKLVNHKAAGSVNGLMGGCLPTGRYAINLVYPTGQAWTTPNETGACAAAEGASLLTSDPGTCAGKPRPVLRSQGTRAVVEVTSETDGACPAIPAPPQSAFPPGTTFDPKTKLPVGYDPNVPFVCQALCADPSLDPTAAKPCSVCLDPTLNPNTSPPCRGH
jgi:hypothetical protein